MRDKVGITTARRLAQGLALLSVLVCCSGYSGDEADAGHKKTRPNILLVVADDLGTLDIGAYGSEIRTPNIDRLARNGVKFTDFHTSATCSPSRAMLLSGVDSHAAGLGNMVEHLAPNQRGQAGYEGHLSDNVVSVASVLNEAGYHTYMAGKWHLGGKRRQLPDRRGFDESFVLLQGGASYFNDMMGLTADVPKALYRHNGATVSALPENFYASEFYADFIIDKIQKNHADNKPFFAYLAFTAPHWPLQVRDEHIDLYKGRYDQGYDALFSERVNAARRLGLIPADAEPADRPRHVRPWSELNAEQRKTQTRTMEIYAAVVERMDFHLGRVLKYLHDIGELRNTLIVFMSDNGADGSDRSKLPGNDKWLPEAWDLRYENMGRKGSYVYPGAAWARASVGPYRLYKEFLSEGGIRSPAIISYPGIVNPGGSADEFVAVTDIAPTLLDFAGVAHPGKVFKGRSVNALTGTSIKPVLEGKGSTLDERVTGWELFGHRAVRQGDWKLLWLSSKPKWLAAPEGADHWALYNLADDPGERTDLSSREPERFQKMLDLWKSYAENNNVVLPDWQPPYTSGAVKNKKSH